MVCIYHSRDLDGWCSAAIVKQVFPTITLIGYDYGRPFPWERIGNEIVVMVDVSLPMSDMIKLDKACGGKLTWIDHHVSAINEYDASGCNFLGVRRTGKSACELTWDYFFREPMPTAVKWLGKYDTFRQDGEWEQFVLPFQMGMRLICNSPETFPSELILDPRILQGENFENRVRDLYKKILADGDVILRYQKQTWISIVKGSFETKFEGLDAICINTKGLSSLAFEGYYNPEKHKLMMAFSTSGNQWNFSIYTTHDDVDCSEIAKRYGEGGHRKASGFSVKSLYGLQGFEQLV